MGLFDFLKSKKSVQKPPEPQEPIRRQRSPQISLEQQLDTFAQFGIEPVDRQAFIDVVAPDWGLEDGCAPWVMTLVALGNENLAGDMWKPNSNDIYAFDQEDFDGERYAEVLTRLSKLVHGAFKISDASGDVNHDAQRASVTFKFQGELRTWELNYEGDHFDAMLIHRINGLIAPHIEGKLFFHCEVDQYRLVVFTTSDVADKINELLPSVVRFEP